ncbi:dentin matrix acidic phosphoprotein 1-like [Oenanthe melanoleuca]|uniref:dentin matrix acidic phosphoprotein 1-like n=1 Tax=Oenanthe melanoleuca TaxID=2939378 RepID=UPI0024C1FCBB|nr:dentin matrix acidic phosphoprotein 1-like [Oenanthe melanoleuca]
MRTKPPKAAPSPGAPAPCPAGPTPRPSAGMDAASSTGNKGLSPVMEEEPRPCSLGGPGCPGPVGTAVAAEAAAAPAIACPAPGSHLRAEPPAAALAGAAGQEEPPEPLAVQQEVKALQSSVASKELPLAATQSLVPGPQRPPGCSPAVRHLARRLSSTAVCQALLHLEQWTDVETGEAATSERQQSPLSVSPAQLGARSERQEGPAERWVGSEQGSSEDSDWDVSWDDTSDEDMSQGEYASNMELSPGVEHGSPDRVPREEDMTSSTWSSALNAETEDEDDDDDDDEDDDDDDDEDKDEDEDEDDEDDSDNDMDKVEDEDEDEEEEPQHCFPEWLASLIPVGTAVAAEAAPLLPRASLAPQSPTEAKPAAAAPSGAAGKEEPPEALAAPQEAQLQQLEKQGGLEEAAGAAVAARAQREQSLVPRKSHMGEELRQQEGVQEEELSQGGRNNPQGGSQGQECAELSQEVSAWEGCTDEEMCHGEVNSSQERSEQEEYLEKGLLQELSAWQENIGQELSQSDVKSWEEVSYWEGHNCQARSQEEASFGQDVSRGNKQGPSAHSSCEDGSDPEVAQEPWEVGSNSRAWMRALAAEQDEWDKLSVLELPLEEDHQEKWRVFAEEGLPVPVPREAWVVDQAPEPCSPEPLCAFPASLHGQAPVGHTASPTRAPHGQPCAPRKRASRFRRVLQALRGLFRFRCLAPPPEE